MKPATAYENKVMPAIENKGHGVATGQVDRRVRVRVDSSGPVPALVIETLGRSPAEVADNAFHPIGGAVSLELQYADALLEAIAKAREAAPGYGTSYGTGYGLGTSFSTAFGES
jgi:hypothetical protein